MSNRSNVYPRLTARGSEKLDPKPKAAYMKIDPETGEVTGDLPRPRGLLDTLARATNRHVDGNWLDGDEDDDDFESDVDDGSLPLYSPHSEGFVDALGISPSKAAKTLLKRGQNPFKPRSKVDASPESADKTENRPAPSKAGGPSPESSAESE